MSTSNSAWAYERIFYHGIIRTRPNLHWMQQVWPSAAGGDFFSFSPSSWTTDNYAFMKITACPYAFPVFSKGRVQPGYKRQAWVVGCGKRYCDVCMEERKERKRRRWVSRLKLMIDWWSEHEGPVIFKTLTVHDDDYPEGHEQLRRWVQRLMRRLRTKTDFQFKYWFITERGSKTKRLHAHAFFFLTKGQKFGIINDVMDTYWRNQHKAFITHHRPVSSGRMGANYAAKYGTKALSMRVCTSKFGWVEFMRRRRLEWLGIGEGQEGVKEWVVVNEDDRNRTLQGAPRQSPAELLNTVTNFSVTARVVAATASESPLKQVEGGIKLCGEKGEPIGMLTMSESSRLIPEVCILSDSSPFAQARRLQAYAVVLALFQTLLTTSNPPDR